jgi:hypothetical protein
VLASGLVRELGEFADQLLVEVAHLDIRDRIWMQVEVGKPSDHLVEEVGPAEAVDLSLELELVDHVLCGRREAANVEVQRVGDRGRVVEEIVESQRTRIEELLSSDGFENRGDVLDFAR